MHLLKERTATTLDMFLNDPQPCAIGMLCPTCACECRYVFRPKQNFISIFLTFTTLFYLSIAAASNHALKCAASMKLQKYDFYYYFDFYLTKIRNCV